MSVSNELIIKMGAAMANSMEIEIASKYLDILEYIDDKDELQKIARGMGELEETSVELLNLCSIYYSSLFSIAEKFADDAPLYAPSETFVEYIIPQIEELGEKFGENPYIIYETNPEFVIKCVAELVSILLFELFDEDGPSTNPSDEIYVRHGCVALFIIAPGGVILGEVINHQVGPVSDPTGILETLKRVECELQPGNLVAPRKPKPLTKTHDIHDQVPAVKKSNIDFSD